MPLIKRYSNRKLYDTLTRHYVTLEEIGWMVENGEDVRVMDHDSNTDITVVTLTQVISDLEKRIGGFFPQSFFLNLIKNRDSTHSFINQGIQYFLAHDDFINQEILRRLTLLLDENDIQKEEFNRFSSLMTDEKFKFPPIQPQPPSMEQVDELKRQLNSLEEELAKIKQNKNP